MFKKIWSGLCACAKAVYESKAVRTAATSLFGAVIGVLSAACGLGCSITGPGVGASVY
jgi:hypothetical protein